MSWTEKYTAVYSNEQGFNLWMCPNEGTESSWGTLFDMQPTSLVVRSS